MSAFVVVPVEFTKDAYRKMLGRELLNLDRVPFESLKQTYSEFIAARPTGPDVPKLLVQRTEAEWREEFERWQRDTHKMPDWWLARSGDEYTESDAEMEWDCWITALRLVGAIKEDAT